MTLVTEGIIIYAIGIIGSFLSSHRQTAPSVKFNNAHISRKSQQKMREGDEKLGIKELGPIWTQKMLYSYS